MKIKSLLAIAALMLFIQSCKKNEDDPHPEAHWEYEHPESWGDFSVDCQGVIQSPIDIITSATLKTSLPDLAHNYADFPITIIDNGHTIQVNTKTNDVNNTVNFNGKSYKLKQFHFHANSEHKINGVQSPMEMHLVHQNDAGEILVVGLMIEEGATANALIDKVWNNIPHEEEVEETKTDKINLMDVIPPAKGYYNYIGSLTTPPCSMGLQWIVMKESLKLSASQISTFKSHYNHNYRPVQPLNNRVVFEKI